MHAKSLIVLLILQTAFLLVLFGKLVVIEEQLAPATRLEKNEPVRGTANLRPADHYAADYSRDLDETQLRRIVREELKAYSSALSVLPTRVPSETSPDAVDEAANQYQMDFVAQKVEYFKSVGDVSDAEMQDLLTEIAKLDKAGRNEMLGRVIRAMNAGEIRGLL